MSYLSSCEVGVERLLIWSIKLLTFYLIIFLQSNEHQFGYNFTPKFKNMPSEIQVKQTLFSRTFTHFLDENKNSR